MESKGLDLELLFEALEFSNPHTLFIDDKGTILKVGKAFQKSSAELIPGKPFDFIFTWLPGSGFNEVEKSATSLLFFQSNFANQRYKVSGRKTAWGYILHANPVVNASFQISDYNLTLKDFSQQNYIAEYLFLLQSSSKALSDLEKINEEYVAKNLALEKSKEELSSTALFPNENPNPVIRLGSSFELLYANPSSARFISDFGISDTTIDDQAFRSKLEEVRSNGTENSSLYLTRNGNTYLVNVRKNAKSNFFNIYAADITHFVEEVKGKESELSILNARLLDQKAFYEYILDSIPSDIAVFDENHKYLFVNPQGISNAEIRNFMIGKDDFDYCHYKGISTEGAEFRREKFNKVIKEDAELEWEDNLVDAHGNRKVILRRMRPIYNPITHKKNVVGYGIDITQRKLAEEEVNEANFRLILLEQFLNAASDAIQVADDSGTFVFMNKRASERLGIPLDKLHEFKVSDIDVQFKDPKVWEEHIDFLKKNGGFSAESTNVHQATGKTIDVEVNVSYHEFGGKGYVIAASRDISERKQNQKILALKNEFQSVLMEVATEFIDIDPREISTVINQTLARIGSFLGVDRVYLFNYNHEEETTSNTYEWVADGISPEIENLQDIPFEYVPVWIETHFKGENIEVENTLELPEGMFKSLLLEQDIKSLIALPLMLEGKCLGFVGLDSVKDFRKFYRDEKDLLQLLARMLVNVDQRIKYTKALEVSNQTIQTMNEDLQKVVQAEKTVNLLADSFMLGADYESICWDIVENVISQLDFEDCVVYQVQGKELVQVAAMGNKTQERRVLKDAMRIPVGKGIVGAVAKTGEAILIPDTTLDKRYLVDDQARLSEVAVPIKVGKKVWGVIDSEHETRDFFTELHLRVLLTLSNLLSQKIAALEEQKMKEKLQEEILAINSDLENRVMEETNRNIELTKSMSDQEKLVTLGEIASGIAHDLNTPLGAIKIGAESIRYTLDNLFGNVVAKCTEEQIKFALNRSLAQSGELFVGGLQQRKEMKEMESLLSQEFPQIPDADRTKMVNMMVKTRILAPQVELVKEVLSANNPLDFLELMYSLQIVHNFIATILTSSERAGKVVQDLRAFIKDQRNQAKGPVNLRSNISTVLNVFNYEIKRSVELIFQVEDEIYIEGFDIKLFQLWSNIIKNAIESIDQYRERGIIKITSQKKGNTVKIAIANNGPEIPGEIRSRIFEKFFTTKAQKNGSGLGLNIVKSVLDEHQAKVSLESNPDWTTFEFSFPLIQHVSEPKNEVEIELL
jgi:PAS domain S-box-containing protein